MSEFHRLLGEILTWILPLGALVGMSKVIYEEIRDTVTELSRIIRQARS